MAGEWAGFFRLRHGDLRVIFFYDRITDTIVVSHVGPRGDVYKWPPDACLPTSRLPIAAKFQPGSK